jgi:hypothetical protein
VSAAPRGALAAGYRARAPPGAAHPARRRVAIVIGVQEVSGAQATALTWLKVHRISGYELPAARAAGSPRPAISASRGGHEELALRTRRR